MADFYNKDGADRMFGTNVRDFFYGHYITQADGTFYNRGADDNDLVSAAGGDDVLGLMGLGSDTLDGGDGWDYLDLYNFLSFELYRETKEFVEANSNTTYYYRPKMVSTIIDLQLGSYEVKWTGKSTWSGDPDLDMTTMGAVRNIEMLWGGDSNDTFRGSDRGELDEIYGYWEEFHPAGGNNTIDGRGGYDVLSYAIIYGYRDSNSDTIRGAVIDFAAGTVDKGAEGFDRFTNIERVVGSPYADTFIGSDNDDEMGSNHGADSFYGGGGFDRVYFLDWNNAGGIDVHLGTGTGKNSIGQALTFKDIEGIVGTHSNDTIRGSAGNDEFFGRRGSDTLLGGLGNDVLNGGEGDDRIDGGAGIDTVSFGLLQPVTKGVKVELAKGTAQDGLGGTDTISNVENIVGTRFNDTIAGDNGLNSLEGGTGDDILSGGDNMDRLYGGIGKDRLFGGLGADLLFGGSEDDTFNGDAGDDSLNGGLGADRLNGDDGNDRLNGDAGNDLLFGGANADKLYGGVGRDTLNGDSGEDRLYGGAEGDLLRGGAGNDTHYGDAGNDTLEGGAGLYQLYGGEGNDTLYGGDGGDMFTTEKGNDMLVGGKGIDSLLATQMSSGYVINLAGGTVTGGGMGSDRIREIENAHGHDRNDKLTGNKDGNLLGGSGGNDTVSGGEGNDRLYGGAGRDMVLGGAGNDLLEGDFDFLLGAARGAGNDVLRGGTGNDTLLGNGGSDTLMGEIGNDALNGGAGNDTLIGGGGADVFILSTGRDVISDFQLGKRDFGQTGVAAPVALDRIDLNGIPRAAAIKDFKALSAFLTSSDAAPSAVFDFGGGNTLTIQNVSWQNLRAIDFIF